MSQPGVFGTYIGNGRVFARTTWGGFLHLPAADLNLTPELLAFGVYDVPFTSYLQQSLRPGAVVVDVGANLGIFTVLMARLVGPTGRVIAYEPVPENLSFLRDNLGMNYVQEWVDVRPVAASDRAGRSTFSFTSRYVGMGSLRLDTGEHALRYPSDVVRTFEVDTVDLGEDLGDAGTIDLVKVDVEGAELEVLRSLRPALHAGRVRALCLEFKRALMGERWPELCDEVGRLVAGGWRLATLPVSGDPAWCSLDDAVAHGNLSQLLAVAP